MSEGLHRVGSRAPLAPEEVAIDPVVQGGPPKYEPLNKGKSKYPFEQIPVGGGMRVKRPFATVKSAVRGWVKRHRGQRFQCWRLPEGWVMVKRLK